MNGLIAVATSLEPGHSTPKFVSGQEHGPPSEPVGVRGQPERDGRIAHQSQRQQQSDSRLRQADLGQVEHEGLAPPREAHPGDAAAGAVAVDGSEADPGQEFPAQVLERAAQAALLFSGAPEADLSLALTDDARIQALQATLAGSLGVAGFASAPALPDTRTSQDQLTSYLTSPNGLIVGRLDNTPLSQRGDAEVGGVWTLVDRWDDDAKGTGVRATLTGVARLGTGFAPRPNYFLDLGTGTGHRD